MLRENLLSFCLEELREGATTSRVVREKTERREPDKANPKIWANSAQIAGWPWNQKLSSELIEGSVN